MLLNAAKIVSHWRKYDAEALWIASQEENIQGDLNSHVEITSSPQSCFSPISHSDSHEKFHMQDININMVDIDADDTDDVNIDTFSDTDSDEEDLQDLDDRF